MNVKRTLERGWQAVAGSGFDRALRRARRLPSPRIVLFWNRGLGDIALGIVPLIAIARERVAGARIVVVTRPELHEPFLMAGADEVHALPGLVRGAATDLRAACAALGLDLAGAVAIPNPDPTRWLEGLRAAHPPALRWDAAWDALADRFVPADATRVRIGVHASAETGQFYGYPKDWPMERWPALFERTGAAPHVDWVLFGHAPTPPLPGPSIIDLRGRTGFLEMMAVIRRRCRALVAPDSGVLTMAYYLDAPFPLHVISLWSDPRQGILKQGCPSPNPQLVHRPLVGRGEDVRNITVDDVWSALLPALAADAHAPGTAPAA
jgi:hypothetical protein